MALVKSYMTDERFTKMLEVTWVAVKELHQIAEWAVPVTRECKIPDAEALEPASDDSFVEECKRQCTKVSAGYSYHASATFHPFMECLERCKGVGQVSQ